MYLTTFDGVPRFRSQQRRHEIDREMRLQICRHERQESIRGRVRLVEAVARELLHQVEDLLDLLLREPARQRSLDKALALLGHLLELLLAHRAAQQVGIAQRVARQAVRDLHHLLLVDDHAVRLFEQLLQLRQIVLHGAPSPLALDEVVHHAALDRARPVQRVQCGQVFQTARLVAPQNIAHARRFELEHAAGESLAEDLVGVLVVERQIFRHQLHAVPFLDQPQGVLDQGERGQPQEVHLEQRQFFQAAHVELRHDFVAVRLVQRDQLLERLRRNHDARRVHRTVAREALQAQRHVQNIIDRRIFLPQLREPGFLLDRLGKRNVQDVGHQLRDAVHVGERHFEHAPHVFDRRARAQRVERDDLRHLLPAVLLGDVLDHLAAAVHAEIHVDIRHAHALRIEEALEQQPVLQRVDVRNRHRIAHQAAGRRPAPRAHRDPHLLSRSG